MDGLRRDVAERYDALGERAWPAPDRDEPLPEEYQRVTAPERYRIVFTRARLWAERLAEVPGVRAEPTELRGFDRGTRVASDRPGTQPLLLLERDGPPPVLYLCLGRPDVVLEMLPDCGCDACDSGSESLLENLDDVVTEVVDGPYVVLQATSWQVRWSPESAAASGGGNGPNAEPLWALCRQLANGADVTPPRGAAVFVNQPWSG
ncbi:DUF6226 family protein [Cryptosporangium arvum]|uniref:DUF6226 family protein n=1 Tax=Cryptosporangium arvum TaxID=80871 RepID=UPI0004AD56B0|nr:DUF6226 family protein [Cryptosporangium arvum]